jgi:hypothetical protein
MGELAIISTMLEVGSHNSWIIRYQRLDVNPNVR